MEHTPQPDTGSEEWFLARLEEPVRNLPDLMAAVERMRSAAMAAQAESRAEMLQGTLAEQGAHDAALEILHRRAVWATETGTGKAFDWRGEVLNILGATWEHKALVEQSGSAPDLAPEEGVRRVRLLRALKPGTLCYDRTWGLGVVTSCDFFYQRTEINFEKKLGHQMSLAYVAESLELIGDDHLLAWKHRRGDELKRKIQDHPGEVVVMALKSFGPSSAAQLQARLTDGIVETFDWKRFWEVARKALKSDPRVVVPANRSEPIRLLAEGVTEEDIFFQQLAVERDLRTIVETVEAIAERSGGVPIEGARRDTIAERLAFAFHGAYPKRMDKVARVCMAARDLGIHDAMIDSLDTSAFFEPRVFQSVLRGLPAKLVRRFMDFMWSLDGVKSRGLLLEGLSVIDAGVGSDIIDYLITTGHEEDVVASYRSAVDNRLAPISMLGWLARNMHRIAGWSLGAPTGVIGMMVDAVEQEASGDRLKVQNQLRERFTRPEWLKDALGPLPYDHKRAIVSKIRDSNGWPLLDRNSILGQIVKLFPEMAGVVSGQREQPHRVDRGPLTSKRSYRERQEQLERIVTVEIPQVAKDIALARSYGDLRENFEFKAAKDAQALLFRRREELELMLRKVTPTDFRGLQSDMAGLATTVRIEYDGGKVEEYHILGEWDSDPSKGIISSTSRMAQALGGHRGGEEVVVPGEQGEVRCRVLEVKRISDSIQQWVEGH
jgi:transcription elongation GreA/GreB family factor